MLVLIIYIKPLQNVIILFKVITFFSLRSRRENFNCINVKNALFPAGSLWGLASSELAWPAVSPVYPSPSLWHTDNPHLHPGQYQPELFGFPGEIWAGARGGAAHSRQLLHYQKQAKKRRRVATASQRRAANIRERRRMFNLNESFDRLRSKVIHTA